MLRFWSALSNIPLLWHDLDHRPDNPPKHFFWHPLWSLTSARHVHSSTGSKRSWWRFINGARLPADPILSAHQCSRHVVWTAYATADGTDSIPANSSGAKSFICSPLLWIDQRCCWERVLGWKGRENNNGKWAELWVCISIPWTLRRTDSWAAPDFALQQVISCCTIPSSQQQRLCSWSDPQRKISRTQVEGGRYFQHWTQEVVVDISTCFCVAPYNLLCCLPYLLIPVPCCLDAPWCLGCAFSLLCLCYPSCRIRNSLTMIPPLDISRDIAVSLPLLLADWVPMGQLGFTVNYTRALNASTVLPRAPTTVTCPWLSGFVALWEGSSGDGLWKQTNQ